MSLFSFLTNGVNCNGVIISEQLVDIVHLIYSGIRIGAPIILILVGMFDMGKAITQQKEDEIKKAQQLLVRKAVAAVIVFLMFSIVSLLFSAITKTNDEERQKENTSIWNCVDNLINGKSTEIEQ